MLIKTNLKKKKIIKKNTILKKAKGGAKNGALYAIAALAIIATFGGVLVGGAAPDILNLRTPPPPTDPYACCDTGNGTNCRPVLENQITYNGEQYALLKSNIFQSEGMHVIPTNVFTPDGHMIFINTSDTTARHYPIIPGCEPGKDLIAIHPPSPTPDNTPWGHCFGIPDEELIYICRDTIEECNKQINRNKVPFDVYYRVKDGPVPLEIASYCAKPQSTTTQTPQITVNVKDPKGESNLQLETFQVKQQQKQNNWLGAWCKPADYFYPTKKTTINFDVKPKGKFTYTDPAYQPGGWTFTADPDGTITHMGKTYPYIYWDASIPNNLITEPKNGYVIDYNDLISFLPTLTQKLGLNQKEATDFTDYWTKHLPSSKYYFVGVIPQSQSDTLAPLSINPTPDSILRVSLFFKPLTEKIDVTPPQINPFTRKGFTVVEWGAIFDTQKHPGFSCLM